MLVIWNALKKMGSALDDAAQQALFSGQRAVVLWFAARVMRTAGFQVNRIFEKAQFVAIKLPGHRPVKTVRIRCPGAAFVRPPPRSAIALA